MKDKLLQFLLFNTTTNQNVATIGAGQFILNLILGLTSSAAILIGIFAVIGAAILRKRFVELVITFFKTAIGFTIVQKGAGVIGATLAHFQFAFSGLTNGLNGVISNNDATAANYLLFTPNDGNSLYKIAQLAAIVYVLAFACNIVLALITKNSNIFTTGHLALYFSICISSIASVLYNLDNGGDYAGAIIFSVLFMGLYMTISCTYPKKWMVRTFQRTGVTVGNTGSLGVSFGGWVGDLVARLNRHKRYVSTERINFPKWLKIFDNTFVSTTTVILIIFLAVYVPIGIIYTWTDHSEFVNAKNQLNALIAANSSNLTEINRLTNLSNVDSLFTSTNFIVLGIIDALTFTAGIEIVNFGVQIFVGQIIASFKGISNRLVKGASAGLDLPTTFPYGPNAVIIGFVFSILGSLVVLGASFGLSFATRIGPGLPSLFPIILPAVVPHFYNGGTVGVFANTKGGVKGVVIAAFCHGFLLSFVPVAFYGTGLVPGLTIPNSLTNFVHYDISQYKNLPNVQEGGIGYPLIGPADQNAVNPARVPRPIATIWGDSDYLIIALIASFSLGIPNGQWIMLAIFFLVIFALSAFKYISLYFLPKKYIRKVLVKFDQTNRFNTKVHYFAKPIVKEKLPLDLIEYLNKGEANSVTYVAISLRKNKLIRKIIVR